MPHDPTSPAYVTIFESHIGHSAQYASGRSHGIVFRCSRSFTALSGWPFSSSSQNACVDTSIAFYTTPTGADIGIADRTSQLASCTSSS
jgi:hypothetical protein